MLKLVLILGATAAGIYVAVRFALPAVFAVVMLFHERFFTKGDEPERPAQYAVPPPDEAAYKRLALEAMAYASRPYVTTIAEVSVLPFETILVRSVSDAYGRRMYVETQRRVSKTLITVLCVYVKEELVASASIETPVSQVRWDAHFSALEDLRTGGPYVSYLDDRGHRREARLRRQGGHHA